MLAEIRLLLGTDLVWAFAPSPGESGVQFIGGSSRTGVGAPLPGELVRLVPSPRADRPSTATDLLVMSVARWRLVRIGAALTVPWTYPEGTGLLVVGVVSDDALPVERGLDPVITVARRLGAAYATARMAEVRQHHQHLAVAAREVSDAMLDGRGSEPVLQAVLAATRRLFDADVAYLALPEAGTYTFAATLGIRTSRFRRLRLGFGEGLGGFARQRRGTVRTLEYGQDWRFRRPPVAETRAEGIRSAMCAPLLIDGAIAGSLYVGNRRLTPFTPEHAELLDEFTELVAAGLGKRRLQEHRLAVIRRQERELLAQRLHDGVVRSLVEVGLEAELGLAAVPAGQGRDRLVTIGRAVESCLDALRASLASFTAETALTRTVPAGEVLAAVDTVPPAPGRERTFRVHHADARSPLDGDVAEALISIGREALTNANVHSPHPAQVVTLELDDLTVTFTVADAGAQPDPEPQAENGTSAPGHFGIRNMRATAERLGGVLHVGADATGRWVVRATLPRASVRS